MNEFDIIEKFFTYPINNSQLFPLTIGDDAALINVPHGQQLVTSIDTLVADVHFPLNTLPFDIGYKSLAVSLSDMAAMAAQPIAVLLALTVPTADETWLSNFTTGFFQLAKTYQVELIGGNLTHGPLNVSTVTYGLVSTGKALRRDGAQPGDDIYVTGTLGNAGLALQQLSQNHHSVDPFLLQRFFRPEPRVAAGIALRNLATAAIDISDGLAADLAKLLQASHAGGLLNSRLLPLSEVLRQQCSSEQAITLALTAGEDYELCFTAPPSARSDIQRAFSQQDFAAQRIGVVELTPGLRIIGTDGQFINLTQTGYQHF